MNELRFMVMVWVVSVVMSLSHELIFSSEKRVFDIVKLFDFGVNVA